MDDAVFRGEIALPDGAGAMEHNTAAGRYTWVEEADLTDANDWYGAAESGKTCEMIFLDGVQRPTIEREQGFDIDALHLKVRIACFALFLDWRGLWRNVVV